MEAWPWRRRFWYRLHCCVNSWAHYFDPAGAGEYPARRSTWWRLNDWVAKRWLRWWMQQIQRDMQLPRSRHMRPWWWDAGFRFTWRWYWSRDRLQPTDFRPSWLWGVRPRGRWLLKPYAWQHSRRLHAYVKFLRKYPPS